MRLRFLPIALTLAAGTACAAAPPHDPPARVDEATISAALGEIRDVEHWSHLPAPSGDAHDPLGDAFIGWTKLLTQLSAADQHDAADRICAAIVELHAKLPAQAMMAPSHGAANAFVRDRFRVGERRVDAAQFFAPERYYPNDPALTKLYRFSVYEGDKVVLRYFLEHSALGEQDYYVLGKSDPASGAHFQVQPYGAQKPTYWTLLERVSADLRDPPSHYPASSRPSH